MCEAGFQARGTRTRTNLTATLRPLQVRCQNLQELVYKQGSAGITKASVSITFHNDDPANGPSGYEDKEYITVTRQVPACLLPVQQPCLHLRD